MENFTYEEQDITPDIGMSNEQLAVIAKHDQYAFELLLNKNINLIYKYAKSVLYQVQSAIDFDDLVQAGTIGLMRAVQKYIPSKKNNFITYATYWIRANIKLEIANFGRLIRVPVNESEIILKLQRIRKQYEDDCITGLTFIQYVHEKTGFSEDRINRLLMTENRCFYEKSVDEVNYQDSDGRQLNVLSCMKGPADTEYETEQKIISEKIRNKIASILSESEYQIIALRNGFFGGDNISFNMLSEKTGKSVQAVRQIERSAKQKLYKSQELKAMLALC